MTRGRLGKDWDNNLDDVAEGNIFKGIFFGVALSIPIWLVIFMMVGIL